MQPNEKIVCPFCGEPSIAKHQTKMDGFRKIGDVLCCALCHAELGNCDTADDAATKPDQKMHDLSMLLGAAPAARVRLAAAPAEQRFCKDCVNFLEHPFVTRCALDNHPVESMHDCEKFCRKTTAING